MSYGHVNWNCSANFIWLQKHLGFQTNFSKNDCSVYYFRVCKFLHFWLSARFPQTNFDTKPVNFFLKLALPVILKEIHMYSPFFSFLHYVYCKTFHTIIPKVVGGGGYSGFQVTGMIKGFFGGRKILASIFLGSLI